MAKSLIAAVWILSLVAWTPLWSGGLASAFRWIAPVMAGVHVVEFFLFRETLERAGGSLGGHFVQTLLFGFFHVKPLETQAPAGEG